MAGFVILSSMIDIFDRKHFKKTCYLRIAVSKILCGSLKNKPVISDLAKRNLKSSF